MFGKIVAGVIGGLMLGVLGALVVAIAFGARPESGDTISGFAFLGLWILALVVAVRSPRAATGWRRIFIASAIVAFAMPLAAFIFPSEVVTHVGAEAGEGAAAVTAGAALRGGVIIAMAGFFGFLLSLLLLVMGLLTGRAKNVVIVRDYRKLRLNLP
jgi:hypothetical protein